MPEPAIRVENLSKVYKIGPCQNGAYRTLRETITDAVAAPFRRLFSRNGRIPSPLAGEGQGEAALVECRVLSVECRVSSVECREPGRRRFRVQSSGFRKR